MRPFVLTHAYNFLSGRVIIFESFVILILLYSAVVTNFFKDGPSIFTIFLFRSPTMIGLEAPTYGMLNIKERLQKIYLDRGNCEP